MTIFRGFAPPTRPINLKYKNFRCEIWPELGGSVASFSYISNSGASIPIFRQTKQLQRYMPTDLACWPLVPYSNRIAYGGFTFEKRKHQISPNTENHPHALHGFGWQRPWQTISQDISQCHLILEHKADDDWPFDCSAEQAFSLTDQGMIIISRLKNLSDKSMPYGMGQHPYIERPRGTKLKADVAGVWLTDDTVMPTSYSGLPEQWNLPSGCLLDDIFMDNCYTDFVGPARVIWPDGSQLEVLGSPQLKFLVVYNPLHEDYVCVEPVSHMTDAINRDASGQKDTGQAVLQPSTQAEGTHTFVYHPNCADVSNESGGV